MKSSLMIFDMDGVLIDVTASYREVTRRTVIQYLQSVVGIDALSDDFISLADVDSIKKSGGLNNDWDLSYTIINLILCSYFDPYNTTLAHTFSVLNDLKDDRKIIQDLHSLQKELDKSELLLHIRSRPVSRLYFEMKDRAGEYSPFLINQGDVKTGNLVKRIFQELYLGQKLFKEIYADKPIFYNGRGYINREVLIPAFSDLRELTFSITLAIATGRPEVEAHYALEHFRLSDIFTAVITEDDIVSAEKKAKRPLRKPHPYSLHLCMERCGYEKGDRIYYIGDMPDDMEASINAGVIPIGFVNTSKPTGLEEINEHYKLLIEKGAQRVFCNFDEIVNYLL